MAPSSSLDSYRDLPVFPLPAYALFPHTLAPFHVFEPRFRAMLDACLSGRRLLVVAGLEPGWESLEAGDERTYDVAGLGRVVSDRRLEGGRYTIFVHGLERVRIVAERHRVPFRSVDVEPLADTADALGPGGQGEAIAPALVRVQALGLALARALGDEGQALAKLLGSTEDPAVLGFRLAGLAIGDAPQRQALLECRCSATRLETLAEHLGRRLLTVSHGPVDPQVGWN